MTTMLRPPRNGQLPFWMSPWRMADRTIVDGLTIPHFVCTVARSRSQRHEGVEIAIPEVAMRPLNSKDRQILISNRLVQALKDLGMVAEGEDQRVFK